MIIAVFFSNLSNWKEEAWKNQGFNGIRTCDLRDTGAMLYQLSYEATHDDASFSNVRVLADASSCKAANKSTI